MQNEWHDLDSEAKAQNFQDRWALRILTCPRGDCRRARCCFGYPTNSCPGVIIYPFSPEETRWQLRRVRRYLELLVAEREACGRAAADARLARDIEASARRRVVAFERARQTLRNGGNGTAGG
jgi:hypothetical protein